MSRKSIYVGIAMVVTIAAVLAGFLYYMQPPPPKKTVTIVLGSTADLPQNLDPHVDLSTPGQTHTFNIFDTLYAPEEGVFPRFNLIPCLAVGEPDISADGLKWTIKLRNDVKFHDGTPFNASAMKFSIDRVKELKGSPAFRMEVVEKVEVIDNYTVRFTLTYPYYAFKSLLGLASSSSVSPTAVKKMGDAKFGENPVGSGPFKFVEWKKGEYVVYQANRDYWDKARVPKCDKFIYKIFSDEATLKLALEKGEVDLAWERIAKSDVPSVLANPQIGYVNYDSLYTHWICINTALEGTATSDVRVRKAIAYSIDKDEIEAKVYNHVWKKYTDRIFHPAFDVKHALAEYSKPDIEKAKKLLAEAGYPNGVDVTLYWTPIRFGKEEADLVVILKEQLAKSGIRVNAKSVEYSTLLAEFRKGIYEMTLAIFAPAYLDTDAVIEYIGHTKSTYGVRVRLSDTRLDELFVAERTERDPAKRKAIFDEIADRLAEQMCYVPLVTMDERLYFRKNVQGAIDYYYSYMPWYRFYKD